MNFISPAFAQAAGSAGASDILMQMAPFALILVIVYFVMLRPQQRRAKEHTELVKNLRRGDTVVTSSGLIGKVTKTIDDAEVELEISPSVKVRFLRQMISEVRSKSEPVKE